MNGAERGYKNIVYITVSTGIGCIIINGDIIHVDEGEAGEFGHSIVQPDGIRRNIRIANIITLLETEAIIAGGGVASAGICF